MAAPVRWRVPYGLCKRIRLSPPSASIPQRAGIVTYADILEAQGVKIDDVAQKLKEAETKGIPMPKAELQPVKSDEPSQRLPRNVAAVYLRPLKREPTHGIPVANLQLRSYNLPALQLASDFALRAAYYLHLPAKGPVPLPRITERWTVPRAHFVHKKSMENWERITYRRLIQIQDGAGEVVQNWLRFLQSKAVTGVGMKADLWEWEEPGVGQRMEERAAQVAEEKTGKPGKRKRERGRPKSATERRVKELLESEPYRKAKEEDERDGVTV